MCLAATVCLFLLVCGSPGQKKMIGFFFLVLVRHLLHLEEWKSCLAHFAAKSTERNILLQLRQHDGNNSMTVEVAHYKYADGINKNEHTVFLHTKREECETQRSITEQLRLK